MHILKHVLEWNCICLFPISIPPFFNCRDMPLRAPPEVVAAAFLAKGLNTSGRTSSIDHREKLLEFISEFFCPVESDLASVDSAALPNSFLEWHAQSIRSSSAQLWARHLHSMWRNLYRKSVEDVSSNPSLHTLLPLPRPFVVPGARFRECYYWDSFWVVRGLIACDLVATAQVRPALYSASIFNICLHLSVASQQIIFHRLKRALKVESEAILNEEWQLTVCHIFPCIYRISSQTWFMLQGHMDSFPMACDRIT